MEIKLEKVKEIFEALKLTQEDTRVHGQLANYAQDKIFKSFENATSQDHYNRRWLYELLQNAVDCTEDTGLTIDISLFEEEGQSYLKFEHNGGYFNPPKDWNKDHDFKNFILAQTGKTPTDESTGKFGTGFLATHCLANKIKVEGICKDEGEGLSYRTVVLDREEFKYEDDESIQIRTLKIIKALKDYDNLKENNIEGKPSARFTYYLTSDGLDKVKEGFKEFKHTVQFVFSCNPKLSKITISEEATKFTYLNSNYSKYGSMIVHKTLVNEVIELHTLTKEEEFQLGDIKVSVSLLKPLKETAEGFEIINQNLLYQNEFGKSMPSLFCSYPLIGSEDFQFPVIINSKQFKPNTERNGIKNNKSSEINDLIIVKAVELYSQMLTETLELYTGQINHLVLTPNKFDFGESSWINKDWYKDTITSIRSYILKAPLIKTYSSPLKRISIIDESNTTQIYFFSNRLLEKLEKKEGFIYDVSKLLKGKIPVIEELSDWQSILWEDSSIVTLDLKAIIEKVSNHRKLKDFALSLRSETTPEPEENLINQALVLINNLCDYVRITDPDNRGSYYSHSKNGLLFPFIPSRSYQFKVFSGLKKDIGQISNTINDQLLDIRQAFFPHLDDLRDSLIHNEISIKIELVPELKEESVIDEVIKGVDESLKLHSEIIKEMESGNQMRKVLRDQIETKLSDFWEWSTIHDPEEKFVKDSYRRKILQSIIDPKKSQFLTANLALDRSGKMSLERQHEILHDEELDEKLAAGEKLLSAQKDEAERFERNKKIGKYFEGLMYTLLVEEFGTDMVGHVDGDQDFVVGKYHLELKSIKGANSVKMHPRQAEKAQEIKSNYYLCVFEYHKSHEEVTIEEFKSGLRLTNEIGDKLDQVVINMASYEVGDDNLEIEFPSLYKSFDGVTPYKYIIKKPIWGEKVFEEVTSFIGGSLSSN
ncbi:hypothetical protein [uncultured Algoriphagus sp.]|mgnify:CR=1 FL=1|uniref:hypothetical protein n=1 Tax=uncultured Algoriphagus sp. TaxID=417365 RepID=UPI0030ED5041|tara:strand:- start:1003 stop:3807 length:2805 start_codon:yes stop_codon:yes gene_type:complete